MCGSTSVACCPGPTAKGSALSSVKLTDGTGAETWAESTVGAAQTDNSRKHANTTRSGEGYRFISSLSLVVQFFGGSGFYDLHRSGIAGRLFAETLPQRVPENISRRL